MRGIRAAQRSLKNPGRFLAVGKGFLCVKGYVLALNPRCLEAVEMDGFSQQMKDMIDCGPWIVRKRYEGKTE